MRKKRTAILAKTFVITALVLMLFVSISSTPMAFASKKQKPVDPSKIPPPSEDITPEDQVQPAFSTSGSFAKSVPPNILQTPSPSPDTLQTSSSDGTYHHLGAATLDHNDGIWSRITVTDPKVPHAEWWQPFWHPKSFFCTWVMTWVYNPSRWIQVGWKEDAQRRNKQYVFVHSTWDDETHYYDQYKISEGDEIIVYIMYWYWGRPPGHNQWIALIWWDNDWQVLFWTGDLGFSNDLCYTGQFQEVFLEGDPPRDPFFVPKTQFDYTTFLIDYWWYRWTPIFNTYEHPYTPEWFGPYSSPYHIVWTNKYYKWYMHTHEWEM